MRTIFRGATVTVAAAIVLTVPIGAANAAQSNDLCHTNAEATLFTSPAGGHTIPAGRLVRILDYRGPYHYLARYDGNVGQLERSKVNQSTCFQ